MLADLAEANHVAKTMKAFIFFLDSEWFSHSKYSLSNVMRLFLGLK